MSRLLCRGGAAVAAAASAVTVLTAGAASATPAHSAAADTARPVATAAAPAHVYPTTIPGLPVRTLPSTSSKIVVVLGAKGTRVSVNCYVIGQAIHGDRAWYHTVAPKTGYVSGYYLATGRDPAKGVPVCQTHHRAQR